MRSARSLSIVADTSANLSLIILVRKYQPGNGPSWGAREICDHRSVRSDWRVKQCVRVLATARRNVDGYEVYLSVGVFGA